MTRTPRPMTEIQGYVCDLRPQDYVDTIGGEGYRLTRVAALVHSCTQLDVEFRDEIAWRLVDLGVSGRRASAAAFRPAHAEITFIGSSETHRFLAEVPCSFRRFADVTS